MKKTDLVLCHMPQWSIMSPPAGISSLSSYLQKHGYRVVCKDYNIELFTSLPDGDKEIIEKTGHQLWADEKYYRTHIYPRIKTFFPRWADEILGYGADIIGFTVLVCTIFPTFDLAALIKQKDRTKKIILGGAEIFNKWFKSSSLANEDIDLLVEGEGEETLKEVMDYYTGRSKAVLADIKGIVYKENGNVLKNEKRANIKDLDGLPFPDYSDYNLRRYAYVNFPIVGSRGCIYQCSFCSETHQWDRFRYRSGPSLYQELKHHVDTYHISGCFTFIDSLVNGNIKELTRFCDEVIENDFPAYVQRKNLYYEWTCKASIRPQMTLDVLTRMKKAGCVLCRYGVESGSANVLQSMNKKSTPALISEVLKNTHAAGIRVEAYWIVGYPVETDEYFRESLDFIEANKEYIDVICVAESGCIIPSGTDLEKKPEKYGIYWKPGCERMWLEWYSPHSTPKIRRKRADDFIHFCSNLGIELIVAH